MACRWACISQVATARRRPCPQRVKSRIMPDSLFSSTGSALRRPHNHQLRTAIVSANWRGCEGGGSRSLGGLVEPAPINIENRQIGERWGAGRTLDRLSKTAIRLSATEQKFIAFSQFARK